MGTIETELERLYREHGSLTPHLVVESAQAPDSPLHSHFEWDDVEAGERYRLDQARRLIKVVKFTVREATSTEAAVQIRAYQIAPTGNGGVYQHVADIARDPLPSRFLLNKMRRDWEDLHRRYRAFEEFSALVRQSLDGEPAESPAA